MMLINSKEQEKKINDNYKSYSRDIILLVVSSRTTEEIKIELNALYQIRLLMQGEKNPCYVDMVTRSGWTRFTVSEAIKDYKEELEKRGELNEKTN